VDLADRGREAFAQRRWAEACEQFRAAAALDADDLERFATAAFLVGNDDESNELWARAHRSHLENQDPERAALAAGWLAFGYVNAGDMAQAGGWMATLLRVLGDEPPPCAAIALLATFEGLQRMFGGDPEGALPMFIEAAKIADQCRDVSIATLCRLGQGQSLVMLGQVDSGVALHDEVMVACTSGAVTPLITGVAYCAVIDSCRERFDIRRAQEWTDVLVRWCDSQPDLVPYRGQCLVHHAQVIQEQGAWKEALAQAHVALDVLSQRPGPAIGVALYALGDLHRLRGSFADSEDSYVRANDVGRSPHPGFALLRLAQGAKDAAVTAIRNAFAEASHEIPRSALLFASVEIELAAGSIDTARANASELADIARSFDVPYLRAQAAHAAGAVALADGDARAALTALREAFDVWRDLALPYERARTRLVMAQAHRALGNEEAATMEVDAARRAFADLGARPDLEALGGVAKRDEKLTTRELEVLRLVASGKTNRAVAFELVLSEKTVARHVANIFTKIGVTSRAAATAYAYEHDLV
jgi:DNA-binding NarL/FixJ family response regulator